MDAGLVARRPDGIVAVIDGRGGLGPKCSLQMMTLPVGFLLGCYQSIALAANAPQGAECLARLSFTKYTRNDLGTF